MRLALLALTLALASCAAPTPTARLSLQDVPIDEASAASLISKYRAAHGLKPVRPDARLARMAVSQARENARAGELSHDRGGSFHVRLASFGAAGRNAAENLAAGADTVDGVIAQWKRSPEHNKNLLLANATQIGIARVDAPETRYKRFWALILTD